ncbi:efflux RND transporter periplasmic adaptor subunit [Pseudonocardia sp. Cha107L01]|uniref:efflux RND transporter periplasmic adaptor subunit n=1 Tax=Pseudonocardia sp. Cha107L01 TaxID=3457576 RepID=UPI00403E684E
MSTKVSASGALASVSSQNLGFNAAAQLIELDVKVGDVVRAGQVLAREDPFNFQQLLNQQQAQLNQQQAILDRLVHSPTVHGDHRTLDQAQKILSVTKRNSDAIHQRDKNSVDRARVALDFAQRQYEIALAAYNACKASEGKPLSMGPCATDDGTILAQDKTAVDTAKGGTTGVIQAKTTYDQAKKTLEVDDTSSRISEENARQSVVTARNAVDSDSSDRGPNIAAQAALVANGAALVANAQRNLNDTVLYAPVAGTVSSITGAVGEYLGAGSGTSALAPGTDASIPGVGAAATSDQSSAGSSGAPSATRPGGGSFIVLNNINTFQVVVPFEESDAAKVAPNQKVQVTFDALPDLTRDGTVLSIAPGGVDISGVTNYYATILLTDTDPRLRTGQTAEAGVLVADLENVLVVPNSAVIKQGGRSFVNVPGPDGKPRQQEFQPGLVGDDNTQVLSGLTEGQQIQLPQATVSGSPGGGGAGGGGGGGGGGGRGGG